MKILTIRRVYSHYQIERKRFKVNHRLIVYIDVGKDVNTSSGSLIDFTIFQKEFPKALL